MARRQRLELSPTGMVTNVGTLAEPPGALTVVQNFDAPAPGFIGRRRGINRGTSYGAAKRFLSASCHAVFSSPLWNAGKGLIFHLSADTAPARDGGRELWWSADGTEAGAFTQLPSPDSVYFESSLAVRSRCFTHNKNAFFVGKPAPLRVESSAPAPGSVSWAGMPRPPGIDWAQQTDVELEAAESPSMGAPFWLGANWAVAYRCTFVVEDKQGIQRESAPSGRYTVANIAEYDGHNGNLAAPVTRWQLPWMTNTKNISWAAQVGGFLPLRIRLYRTVSTNISTVLPNDEMQLCYEAEVTADDFVAGFVTVRDYTPDFGLGAYLYTNSVLGGDVGTGLIMSTGGADGLVASNDRPPACDDGAMFAGCAFYGNTKTLERAAISLLAVGTSPPALKAGDVVSVDGTGGSVVAEAVAGAPATISQYRIYDTATPSLAWCVRRTIENLCACLNKQQQQDGLADIVAWPMGDDSSPGSVGRFMLEALRQQDVGHAFYVGTSSNAAWQPTPDRDKGTIPLKSESAPNGLAISKPLIPDAVPPSNYFALGGADNQVLRLAAVTDALFIFLERGVWVCRGTGPSNFVFQPFDTDFRLWARESVCVMGEYVYAWGFSGLVRFSVAGGVERIDGPIRNYVESIWQEQYLVIPYLGGNPTFTVAQPHFNRVCFWFPRFDLGQNRECTDALVFHTDTGAWTRYQAAPHRTEGAATYLNDWYCACVRAVDSATFFVPRVHPWTANLFVGCMQDSPTSLGTDDVNQYTGGTATAPALVTWAATVPNPGQLCHWSEFEFFAQPGLWSFRYEAPDGFFPANAFGPVSVGIASDLGQLTSAQVTQLTGDKGRIILATQSGYGTRQTVTLSALQAGFYAFVGFALLYRPLGGLNTR